MQPVNAVDGDTNSISGSFFKRFHYISIVLIVSLTILVIVFAMLLFMSVNASKISEGITGRQNIDIAPKISNQGVEGQTDD